MARYVSERSVEQKILELQAAKGLFSKGALQKVDSEQVRKARLDVLKGFFGYDHREELTAQPGISAPAAAPAPIQ